MDADGDVLSFAIDSPPSSGTVSDPTTPICDGLTPQSCSADVTYTPAADTNGSDSFVFSVDDGIDGPTTATIDITVDSVNDAPSGQDKIVGTDEDVAYAFTTSDFGFTDGLDTPANVLDSVEITTLPTGGSLTDNGTPFPAGTFVSANDITGGLLEYNPASNANGPAYDSFTFQVKDDGGTLHSGIDVDPTARNMTIDVAPVADAPTGANKTVTATEDQEFVFADSNFGFSDVDGNNLVGVTITTLPDAGTLKDDGNAVDTLGQVSEADISGGKLTFTPAANANGSPYTSFTFQVQDDGLSDNLDVTPRTITIDVDGIDDAPVGTNKTIGVTENGSHTFSSGDFGFTDPNDTPAGTFTAVKISTVPGNGTLANNGTGVNQNDEIAVADLGLLVFTPDPGETGLGYASFDFQVKDDGVSNNLDITPRTITINVTPINHAPAGTDKTVGILEDAPYTFGTADFGFSDTSDGNSLLAVKVTTLATAGTLLKSGSPVALGASVLATDITAGKLTFVPAANVGGSPYASFTFQVQDDGGIAAGGVDLDQTANTFTFNVTLRNDAPTGTSNSATISEEAAGVTTPNSYTLKQSDFGFADANDSPPDSFIALKIATLPTAGSLKDNGVAVSIGQLIPIADITGSKLVMTPVVNGNGAPYATFTFQVEDDGGTLNSGSDLDPTPNTFSLNVTPVQDPPDARSDSYLTDPAFQVPENAGPRLLPVLGNDIDVDGDPLQIIAIPVLPAHGVIALLPGGTGLTYDPDQLYSGEDSFRYTISDGQGGTDTATVTLNMVLDNTPPTLGAIVQLFYPQTVGSSTVKAVIAWSGTDAGTGIARFEVQQSTNGGGFATVSASTATGIARTLTDNTSYRFRFRGIDNNGNVSPYVYGPIFTPHRYQNSSTYVHYSGTWHTASSVSALGGSHRYATASSARAWFTTSTQNFGLVMTKNSVSGSAQVWIDGAYAGTVNLKKTKSAYKGLVFSWQFPSLALHKIEIRPVGNGRVYLDAILILR